MTVAIETQWHRALLDIETGIGALVLPDVSTDVVVGVESVHAADLRDMLSKLGAQGWELLDAEDITDGEPRTGAYDMGETRDGLAMVALVGDGLTSSPSVDELVDAERRLKEAN